MNCPIEGVMVRELQTFNDRRGWLVELFRDDELIAEYFPAMAYVSLTFPGVARGPHEHKEQADYFCFLGPSIFRIYLWDNRPDSPTFRKHWRIDAGENQKISLIVPPGVVHAYKNIGDRDGIVYNAPNRLYAGQGKGDIVDEIRHEDDPSGKFSIVD
jgi:dTDP-4-dehydrorhamnose 3,5-epimerase